MKTAFLILMFCAVAIQGYAAEEPEFSTTSAESLIASLPTFNEVQSWLAKPAADREKLDPEFAAKMKGGFERYKELYALIKPGKSILDYPGMLSLGMVKWDAATRTNTFIVAHIGSKEILGFTCTFSESGVILNKEFLKSAGL